MSVIAKLQNHPHEHTTSAASFVLTKCSGEEDRQRQKSTFLVSNQGAYFVKVIANGCDTTGKINVSYATKPIVKLGKDTSLCTGELLLLDAYYPQSTYLWQNGSSLSNFNVMQPGTYSVDVSNTCGITSSSIVIVYENCDCKFYMPSAFTPNNDGTNDIFRPNYKCLFSNYEMKVFNRWGQLIFNSKNPLNGWNGTYNNQQQPIGVYAWELVYKDNLLAKKILKKGTVMLIR